MSRRGTLAQNPPEFRATKVRQWATAFGSPLCRAEQAFQAASRLLYPPVCVFCESDVGRIVQEPFLCSPCRAAFNEFPENACLTCAFPLPSSLGSVSHCPYCRKHAYRFARTTCLGLYRAKLREAVLRMKRSHHEPLALAAGRLLGERVSNVWRGAVFDVIIPMPTHWTRRFRRGMNGAELLAEGVSREVGAVVNVGVMRCLRLSGKQGTLSPAARFPNVRGVFGVRPGYDIKAKDILLVDDIMTTGATAHEAARILRRAGAGSVSVAVVARGVGADFPSESGERVLNDE